MHTLRRLVPIIAILLAGLAGRLLIVFLVLPHQGYAQDLDVFAHWANVLRDAGPGGFYQALSKGPVFVYPPPYQYLLWPIGLAGADWNLLKLPAIAADVATATLLWWAGSRWLGTPAGLAAAALFLCLPPIWIDSAAWGQMDGVLALAMLASVVLLAEHHDDWALVAAVMAVLVKPQGVLVFVVIVPVFLRRHLLGNPAAGTRLARPTLRAAAAGVRSLSGGALLALAAVVAVLLPFDMWAYAPSAVRGVPVLGQLAGLVRAFTTNPSLGQQLSFNAFNPWALVGPSPLTAGGTPALDSWSVAGVPAVVLGAILFGSVCLVVAVGLLLRDDWVAILLGLTIVGAAFFLLPTRVHERYLVPALAPAALLAATSLAAAGLDLVAGLLYSLNLLAVLRGGLGLEAGAGQGVTNATIAPLAGVVGDLANWAGTGPGITVIAVGLTAGLAALLAVWAQTVRTAWPPRLNPQA